MELVILVYSIVKSLPNEEKYALADQMRRCVVSIPSNIAEGHGRDTDKEFIKFLHISRGSLLELETQIEICFRLNYIPYEKELEILDYIYQINKMINSLIAYRCKQSHNDKAEDISKA